ncbi:hypothetical protein K469DRAFT_733231 [Zopfia rhizophila CBS 207.26]|uniref:tRNA wybutosine-synthesizing protein 3 n=1 Tax=Zopfia rhizophila CBS 207.26 TaxID=1314779 RepID=A0A6A6EG44_9PEZI|nr:hypothetical protein K469DRAFT_733231 [Zopfia rhizophila CBS 207.26]
MQSRFEVKKQRILEQLNTQDENYHDLSPKGSIDKPIRSLIDDINHLDGLVTTSSCSGRISVFLEGKKKDGSRADTQGNVEADRAGPGGKGGGSWLFISHSPVETLEISSDSQLMSKFGMKLSNSQDEQTPSVDCRYIHIKFEPMILHILAASLDHTQRVLSAAISAGFRESGAMSLTSSKTREMNPMVAVRSTGYSYDAIIGYQDDTGNNVALVDEMYLRTLVGIANERFKTNAERISRFRSLLLEQYGHRGMNKLLEAFSVKQDWEDPDVRRERKRKEGLRRQRGLEKETSPRNQAEIPNSTQDGELNWMFD